MRYSYLRDPSGAYSKVHRENIRRLGFKLTLLSAFRVIDMQFN